MAMRGQVFLLDAWVPRGTHSGYVATSPAELAALKPRATFIGHGHFDHAADAARPPDTSDPHAPVVLAPAPARC